MKKPTLADMAAKKPAAVSSAPAGEEAATTPGERQGRAGAQPDGRKGILVRVAPEGWRELRDLAADLTLQSGNQVTMQSLIVGAVNDLLKENGRPPLA